MSERSSLLMCALALLEDLRREGIDMDLPCQCDADDDADWTVHRGDCSVYWHGRINVVLAAAAEDGYA